MRAGKIIAHPAVILLLKLVAAGLFVVTVMAGFIGDQNPYRNIAPTMVWIIVWVGVAYVSAFVGDLWALINPWATIFDAAAWAVQAGRQRARISVSPALSRSTWRLARGRPAPRLFLDRTRLSGSCRAEAYRVLRSRLFGPDLDRHGAVRPRDLDAAWRSVLCRLRHLRALRADGSARWSTAGIDRAAVRCRPSRQPKRLAVDDGIRAPAALHRPLRRPSEHAGMDDPGECGRRTPPQPRRIRI